MRFCSTGILALVVAASVASVAEAAELTLSSSTVKQGQTIEVTVTGADSDAAPDITFNKRVFKTFPVAGEPGKYQALIVAPALIKPGKYELATAGDAKILTVTSGQFGVQRITLPKGKDNFDGSPGERQAVEAAKATLSAERLWKGAFTKPSKARVSSRYGLRRAVNGRMLPDYFHSGVDFAGGLGGPVHATASGKVLIAHRGWKLHGNTVAIDHGQGVVSFYIHLNSILVKEGQTVEAGQKIGTIGATGRANGPHLHFSLYVNNDATNPGDWFAPGF